MPDDADPERVLGDGFRLRDAEQEPARAGDVLQVAHLEQEGRRSGERVLCLLRGRQARLIPHVDAAAALGADEPLVGESADCLLHRHVGDAEELGQLGAGR